MTASTTRSARLAILLAAVVMGAACAGGARSPPQAGGEAPGAESDLPVPPSGKATVGGTVTVDGKPVSGESLSLLRMDGDKAKIKLETASDGTFVVEAVEPGTYAIVVSVLVRDAQMPEGGFGLEWDTPCKVEGYSVLNTAVSKKSTGESAGVIATASNEGGEGRPDTPFEVGANERVTQDIAFECGTAA